jgi:hypothetical protein
MAEPDHKRCLGCGYILDGLPEPRCPECGRGFDPLDSSTFRIGRRTAWVWLAPAVLGVAVMAMPLILDAVCHATGFRWSGLPMPVRMLALMLGLLGWIVEFVAFFVYAVILLAKREHARSPLILVAGLIISGVAGPGVLAFFIHVSRQMSAF